MKFERRKIERDDIESLVVVLVGLCGYGLFVWAASSLIRTIGCVL